MKYKFVSKEQARNDWENGRVQIEHIYTKGNNIKLIELCMMFGDKSMPSCSCDYYIIRFSKDWFGSNDHFPGIPSVPTDELWEMIFGEYQEEIIGYELNRKVSIVRVAKFLCKKQSELMGLITDKEVIKEASDLGILSTCFKPVFKEREVKVNYTRNEVIELVDELLQYPDALIDAVNNENTHWGASELIELAERDLHK